METPSLTVNRLTEVLSCAVRARDSYYNNFFALTIRWENYDTHAARDAQNFQNMLRTLNVGDPEHVILGEDDDTPGWTLVGQVRSVFARAKRCPGKSIVFIHYTGYGKVNHENKLIVQGAATAPGRRIPTVNISTLVIDQVCDEETMKAGDTDTVFVLDCCYSHVVTRKPSTMARTVEILAATDDSNPNALAPPHNTLTRKLQSEVARRKREGHQFVRLSDVMATIRARSPTVKPTHHIKVGSSICLPFTGITPRPHNPDTIGPPLRAVFAVDVPENASQELLERITKWIRDLPPSLSMELDGVYRANSTLLIIQGAYAAFSELAGFPNVKFISDVSSRNLRQDLGPNEAPAIPDSGSTREEGEHPIRTAF